MACLCLISILFLFFVALVYGDEKPTAMTIQQYVYLNVIFFFAHIGWKCIFHMLYTQKSAHNLNGLLTPSIKSEKTHAKMILYRNNCKLNINLPQRIRWHHTPNRKNNKHTHTHTGHHTIFI